MRQEISGKVEMHVCYVEKVHDSGLIDAQSVFGKRFEYVNVMTSGSEGFLKEGSQCLIITDGTQKWVMGEIRHPQTDEEGKITIRNTKNDLSGMERSKSIEASDDMDNQSKIALFPAGGIVLDAGERVITHMDAGRGAIKNYVERLETVSTPMYSSIDHDDGECSIEYKYRTEVDYDSVDRDMLHSQNDTMDKGNTVSIKIGPKSNVLNIVTRNNGTQKSSVQIDEDGSITIDSSASIKVKSLGDLDIEAGGNVKASAGNVLLGSHMELMSDGRVAIGRPGFEVVNLIDQISNLLPSCTVATPIGVYPLIAAPVQALVALYMTMIKKQ